MTNADRAMRKATRSETLSAQLEPRGYFLEYVRGHLYPRGAWWVSVTIEGIPFHAEADNLDGVQRIVDALTPKGWVATARAKVQP